MSLRDAVLELADSMDNDAKDSSNPDVRFLCKLYAGQLRIAAKAASGEESTPKHNSPQQVMDPNYQNFLMIEKARKELREEKEKKLLEEEKVGSAMILVVGGSLDGTYVPSDPNMRVGQKPVFSREVYEYRNDHKLHFSENDTREMLNSVHVKSKSTDTPSRIILPE